MYIMEYKIGNNTFLNIYSTCSNQQFELPDIAKIFSKPELSYSNFILQSISIIKYNDLPKSNYLNDYLFESTHQNPSKFIQEKLYVF